MTVEHLHYTTGQDDPSKTPAVEKRKPSIADMKENKEVHFVYPEDDGTDRPINPYGQH